MRTTLNAKIRRPADIFDTDCDECIECKFMFYAIAFLLSIVVVLVCSNSQLVQDFVCYLHKCAMP